ncbi:hypothetical protein MOQ72_14435 [Saccharopolyspora sp. K220]|uniref:hypothetical protein n=1 Tax=Saccharopolyspora soli TaxID=2926618 RepID=UPI001F5A6F40|nr:hypothetical protein [Saccharopolyspora soli]MCI2418634.1 hypothetical protein [Saccharopolyspora soli]
MDLEDELQRILRDDRLDIPVRTGAEWSLVAGARRRRQRTGMLAAMGSALAATLLVGAGVAVISNQSDQPVQPAVPSISQTVPDPRSTAPLQPSQPPGLPPVPQVPGNAPPVHPNIPGRPTRTSEPPTLLRTTTSKPRPTTSEPPVTSNPSESASQQPATEPDAPGP